LLKGPAFRVFTRQRVRSQLWRMLLLHICRCSYGVYPYKALHFRKRNRFRYSSSHRLRTLSYS
jgi:hypothetical protein